jgi:nitroimidazol reductase NimA-like FMN-containing flavoprotein (pyridoxamine 5'-phosphate oxidase superfamily)
MPQELNEEEIEFVLQHQLLGHIGCHADNLTYVVPICYAYDGKTIYGRTYEGMKIKMVRKNPAVCFQVESIENMSKWKSVVCWGEFEELTDFINRNKAISILQDRISAGVDSNAITHSSFWPFSISDLDHVKGIIFCIHVNKMTGMFSS